MDKTNKLQETFKDFAQQASMPDANANFLEKLRELTGQSTVPEMLQRFQKLAGIKSTTKKT